MEQRLGLLGGSFNPVHVGHLTMAQDALERFSLDRVMFMPAANPPHKNPEALISGEHRLAMLKLAVESDARFEVSDDEIRRGGISYSVDTVRRMHAMHPGASLFFIIGSDTLRELHTWHDVYGLLELCEVITIARPGFAAEGLASQHLNLRDPWPARLARHVIVGHLCEISSTDIRSRAAHGLSLRYLVPPAVERYIQDMQLYQREEKPQ